MIKATQNARVFNSSKSVRAVEMNNSNHSSTGIISSCNITDDNYEANLRKIITSVLKELNLGNPKHVRFENDSEHKESHHRDMRSRHYNDSSRLFNSAGKYRSPTRYETGYSDDRLPSRTDHRSMHSRSYNDRSRRAIGDLHPQLVVTLVMLIVMSRVLKIIMSDRGIVMTSLIIQIIKAAQVLSMNRLIRVDSVETQVKYEL